MICDSVGDMINPLWSVLLHGENILPHASVCMYQNPLHHDYE